ncbi:MAG TPA: YdeI/OmpD-associated family protein [Lacunisphaera sp.]|jgi:uncharacterized protein YdeI (YjbR/CyaY-like superfamily)
MIATHFTSAVEFRQWLGQNHASATELHVGFHRKNSGLSGMTYAEAIDEALCFGWIDGVIRKIDAHDFMHRFTPRKSTSIWSNRNLAHVARLTALGKMQPAGLRAFEARKPGKTGVYSFEQKEPPSLSAPCLKKFKANRGAWAFFQKQAPSYRRRIIHWIISAKQAPTQLKRLDRTIAKSAEEIVF